MVKYTKIVATIGPASDSIKTLGKMYAAGMNVARLNFSHGDYSYFKKVIANIRTVSPDIAILLDTKGPEIRTGEIKDGSIQLEEGDELILTNREILGDNGGFTLNYDFIDRVEVGNLILIDDGLIETKVIKSEDSKLTIKVLNRGILGSKKTVSIRGHNVEIPFMSEKDKNDILFGIEQNVDFIAASFVRSRKDVLEIKKLLDENNGGGIKIISKIEHGEAVDNFDDILEVSKGIMVARGDLGVEIPLEEVPSIQRDIVKKCNELGRPVIVATQMLESMKDNPRPTRAEVADVSAAIIQGTDAIMLSGETASGKYPVGAIKMMSKIAGQYDGKVKSRVLIDSESDEDLIKNSISIYVTKAAYQASEDLKTSAILIPTESGYTARKVSRYKPKCPIFAITHDPIVSRQLQLSWGVFPMVHSVHHEDHDAMVDYLVEDCYDKGLIKENDRVVVTSGHILFKRGHTNMLEIYRVADVLGRCQK